MEKAAAVKYYKNLPAPLIIAKGKGELARKIKNIAHSKGIKLVHDEKLAENLIELDVGSFIPEEFYEIIAKILVFVKKLD